MIRCCCERFGSRSPHDFRTAGKILSTLLLIALMTGVTTAEDNQSPSVGTAGTVSSVVMLGSKLKGKPLVNDPPMVVQVVNTFPHVDGFRYDLRFQGFEPGKYDLAEWLVREDGSEIGDLPKIEVEIVSLLPAGQVTPHELGAGSIPFLGGYQWLVTLAAIAWSIVLLALILGGRRKNKKRIEQASELTLADLLHERLSRAYDQKLEPKEYAELERMLLAMWRRRLKLENVPTDQALRQIRDHKDAGPLMRQIENWMHSPKPLHEVDLPTLLKPYQGIPATALDQPGVASNQASKPIAKGAV
jgi:hypothetical protein